MVFCISLKLAPLVKVVHHQTLIVYKTLSLSLDLFYYAILETIFQPIALTAYPR